MGKRGCWLVVISSHRRGIANTRFFQYGVDSQSSHIVSLEDLSIGNAQVGLFDDLFIKEMANSSSIFCH